MTQVSEPLVGRRRHADERFGGQPAVLTYSAFHSLSKRAEFARMPKSGSD